MAKPYKDDPRFLGVELLGGGQWAGITIKIFYITSSRSGDTKAGEPIGEAQDLSVKYPGITNHIHLEVRFGDRILSPDEVYFQCL